MTNLKLGPYTVISVYSTETGGHGGWGEVVLKRPGFQPMSLYMESEEAEELRPLAGSKWKVFLKVTDHE